jgi:hypothetical protein
MSFVLVPDTIHLLRLPKPDPDFAMERASITHAAFVPSSPEKQQTPVRVSVWDETRTSATEAAAFRGAADVRVFRILSEKRKVLQEKFPHVSVVYDPLEPERAVRPGGYGHAGIVGVDSRQIPGALTRAERKERALQLRTDLAACCEPVLQ